MADESDPSPSDFDEPDTALGAAGLALAREADRAKHEEEVSLARARHAIETFFAMPVVEEQYQAWLEAQRAAAAAEQR